jgi:hypothetical protein
MGTVIGTLNYHTTNFLVQTPRARNYLKTKRTNKVRLRMTVGSSARFQRRLGLLNTIRHNENYGGKLLTQRDKGPMTLMYEWARP